MVTMSCGSLTFASEVQPSNTYDPSLVMPLGRVTPVMAVPLNALLSMVVRPVGSIWLPLSFVLRSPLEPMAVRALGSLVSTRLVQPLKASYSMVVISSLSSMVGSDSQSRKALCPITRMPSCIFTLVKFEQ